MRLRRTQLGVGAQHRAASAILRQVVALSDYRRSRHIALYHASGGEVDCSLLLQQAWRDGKSCYLPIIARDRQLHFRLCGPSTQRLPNRLGILEPVGRKQWPAKALDLVLMPLVAVDARGHRVGMGGGFYDKTFAACRSPLASLGWPRLLGVAHRFQRLPLIELQPWDVPLHKVICV